MGTVDQRQVVEALMKGVTILNPAAGETTTLEGIVSGRLLAQVLMQMNPSRFEDDEEVSNTANVVSDEEIPLAECETNCRMIARKLEDYFESIGRPYSSLPGWNVEASEIVVDRDMEAIAKLLTILLTAAIFCGRREVSELLDHTEEPEKSHITALMMSFTNATVQSAQNGKNSDTIAKIKMAIPSSERHAVREAEKLKKKMSALQSELNELRSDAERIRALEEELAGCRAEIREANERVKHYEAASSAMSNQFIQFQKSISDLEFENDRLTRNLEAQAQTLELLRNEKQDMSDEMEALRYRESQLQRDLKNSSEKQASYSERGSNALRNKEKELEFANRRLKDYVEQLAQYEGQTVKIQSLEQMLKNEKDQREAVQSELTQAIRKCNEMEAETFQLRKQLRNESSKAEAFKPTLNHQDDASSASTSACVSLHDDLNGSASELGEEGSAEWKTKYEVLAVEHTCLEKELADTKEILQRVGTESDTRIANERAEREKITLEQQSLVKRLNEMRQANESATARIHELENGSEQHCSTISQYSDRLANLEEVIADAANVIRFYSSAAEGKESSVEVVKLKSQVDKLQRENDNLRSKQDQNQYESTQEQRLITSAWHEAQFALFRLRHGPGATTSLHSPSTGRRSAGSAASQQPGGRGVYDQAPTSNVKSFLTQQMDAYGCGSTSSTPATTAR